MTWDLLSWCGRLRYLAKRDRILLGGELPSSAGLRSLLANLPDWNLYAQLNPAPGFRGLKAATRHVTHLRYLVIDLDPTLPGVDVLPTAWSLALEHDATLLDSGRGAQVWVHLDPVPLNGPDQRARIERGIGTWLRFLPHPPTVDVDTSCSDLARVVRMPDSINQKTGRPARLLRRGSPIPMFTRLMDLGAAPAETGSVAKDTAHLGAVIPHLTETAARFLTEGWVTPGRHAAAYAAAASLRDAAVELEWAEAWVSRGGSQCEPPLPPSDSQRAVHNAYDRA